MAVKGGTGDKPGVPIPIIVIAVIALIAFVGWMGMRAFAPEGRPDNELTRAHDKWMDQIAKQSGGDFSKVPAEDQGKLQKETYGHGDLALKDWIKDHPIK